MPRMPSPRVGKRWELEGSHETPITCERCGAKAHLIARRAVADGHASHSRERREYECDSCKQKLVRYVDR
jgi:hypothetical protein